MPPTFGLILLALFGIPLALAYAGFGALVLYLVKKPVKFLSIGAFVVAGAGFGAAEFA